MSVPPRRLPKRPSLEQLRKQAKEHLETLRAVLGGLPRALRDREARRDREAAFLSLERWAFCPVRTAIR